MKEIALVTGGSGNIGRAICKALARRGYCVAIHYCGSYHRAEALKDEIIQGGGDAFVTQADVTNEQEIEAMFELVCANGDLCVLVNNAGGDAGRYSGLSVPLSVCQQVMALNYEGPVRCMQLAVPQMVRLGKGFIINILSQAAVYGGVELSHYAAAKAALGSFSIGMAKELIALNIRLNNVSPGVVDTEYLSPEKRDEFARILPAGRCAKTSEIADVVCWLASDSSSYVAGATLPVSGAR